MSAGSFAVQPIRPAATVVIIRAAEPQYEIFMLRRTERAAFAGGMYVFPGGRVDGDDHLHRFDALRLGPSPRQARQQQALGAEWRGYWVAGIRETFEEAGLLLAYDASGRLLEYTDGETAARFADYRHALHDGRIGLDDICTRENLRLAFDRIHFFNRWVTPAGRPRRFDTRFFIAEAPGVQAGGHDAKETIDSVWISPRDAIRRHDRDDFGLMAVTRRQLDALAAFERVGDVIAWSESRTEFPVFRPVLPAQ